MIASRFEQRAGDRGFPASVLDVPAGPGVAPDPGETSQITLARPGRGAQLLVLVLVFILCEPSFLTTQDEFVASLLALAAFSLTQPRGRRPFVISLTAALMCALFTISVIWSHTHTVTLFRAAMYAALALIAALIQTRHTLRELIWLLRRSLLVVSLVCVATAAAMPTVGLEGGTYQAGALQGIFYQKNLFGYAMLIGLVTTLCDDSLARRRKGVLALWFAALILLASSSTAILVGVGAVLMLVLLRVLSRSAMWQIGLLYAAVIGTIGAIATFENFDVVAGAVGRNASLTGRTGIWDAVWTVIQRHPYTGTGWGSAWGTSDAAGNEIRGRVGFFITHAHDGFLDVWLQVGVFGALLLALMLLLMLVSGTRLAVARQRIEFRWVVAIGVILALYSADEVRATKLLGWWLMCAGLTYCAAETRRTAASPKQVPTTPVRRSSFRGEPAAAR